MPPAEDEGDKENAGGDDDARLVRGGGGPRGGRGGRRFAPEPAKPDRVDSPADSPASSTSSSSSASSASSSPPSASDDDDGEVPEVPLMVSPPPPPSRISAAHGWSTPSLRPSSLSPPPPPNSANILAAVRTAERALDAEVRGIRLVAKYGDVDAASGRRRSVATGAEEWTSPESDCAASPAPPQFPPAPAMMAAASSTIRPARSPARSSRRSSSSASSSSEEEVPLMVSPPPATPARTSSLSPPPPPNSAGILAAVRTAEEALDAEVRGARLVAAGLVDGDEKRRNGRCAASGLDDLTSPESDCAVSPAPPTFPPHSVLMAAASPLVYSARSSARSPPRSAKRSTQRSPSRSARRAAASPMTYSSLSSPAAALRGSTGGTTGATTTMRAASPLTSKSLLPILTTLEEERLDTTLEPDEDEDSDGEEEREREDDGDDDGRSSDGSMRGGNGSFEEEESESEAKAAEAGGDEVGDGDEELRDGEGGEASDDDDEVELRRPAAKPASHRRRILDDDDSSEEDDDRSDGDGSEGDDAAGPAQDPGAEGEGGSDDCALELSKLGLEDDCEDYGDARDGGNDGSGSDAHCDNGDADDASDASEVGSEASRGPADAEREEEPAPAGAYRRRILDDDDDDSHGGNEEEDDDNGASIESNGPEGGSEAKRREAKGTSDGAERSEAVLAGALSALSLGDDADDSDDDPDFGGGDDDSFGFASTDEASSVGDDDESADASASVSDDDDDVACFEACGCWRLDDGAVREGGAGVGSRSGSDLYLASSDGTRWPRLRLPLVLYDKLFRHQRIGVQWMASLHRNEIRGGILADDMGLGKTMRSCAPGPYRTLGLISNHITDLNTIANTFPDQCWNYVVLDEGHLIKNRKTKTSQDVRILARNKKTRRLLLTGTPIQNNMRELHALFDWATSSQLLGSIQTFLNKYGDPIEEGRQRNASDWTIKKSAEMNAKLKEVLQPYFLQRLKKTEFGDKLPGKKELVVFTDLSPKQRRMYEDYTANVFDGETTPLAAVSWLKMLCGHPSLPLSHGGDRRGSSRKNKDPDALVRDSAKLQVLLALITRLKRSGHRTLVFSQSTKMLDIMEKVLDGTVKFSRIDGSSAQNARQRSVDHFNDPSSGIDVMLLSTKAAGVGLTLTGADRAVIYDPSWNPAEDSQAVDRCYRIGQTKSVTVYRFIAAGTVEEKMYEKQVHKDGIKRVILSSDRSTARYFDRAELADLFKLSPEGECSMMAKFREKMDNNAAGSSGKPSFLTKHPLVIGVASHDVLYSNASVDVDLTSPRSSSEETPFSRSPFEKTNCGTGNEQVAHIEDLTLDAPQPVQPLGGLNRTRQNRADAKTRRKQESGDTAMDKSNEAIDTTLNEADALIENRQYERVMNMLLGLIESHQMESIKVHQKLDLHKKVSHVATILGWL
ncbi:hypothetical protein ACHAWF_012945 [Thalassiosira exigua]